MFRKMRVSAQVSTQQKILAVREQPHTNVINQRLITPRRQPIYD